KDQLVALQYAGYFWRDGRVFNSSWSEGRPAAVTIGTGQVMKGWDRGLVGQRVGSRVLLVVPPSLGYGSKGLPRFGIEGHATLVCVVDLLGAHWGRCLVEAFLSRLRGVPVSGRCAHRVRRSMAHSRCS